MRYVDGRSRAGPQHDPADGVGEFGARQGQPALGELLRVLHVGRQEDIERCMVRELREEIKLEVTNVEFLFARTLPKAHQVEIYFRCKPASVPTPSSFEIIKAEWFMIEELPDKLSSDQRTLIKRALAVGEKSNE